MRQITLYHLATGEQAQYTSVQLPLGMLPEDATEADWAEAIQSIKTASGLEVYEGVLADNHIVIDGVAVERPINLPALKMAKWEAIKVERDRKETEGFPYMGKIFQSDSRSVQRITTAVQAAQSALALGQPFLIEWATADNSTVDLDAPAMLGLPVALAGYANHLHQLSRSIAELIEAATTPEELAAVVWPLSF